MVALVHIKMDFITEMLVARPNLGYLFNESNVLHTFSLKQSVIIYTWYGSCIVSLAKQNALQYIKFKQLNMGIWIFYTVEFPLFIPKIQLPIATNHNLNIK